MSDMKSTAVFLEEHLTFGSIKVKLRAKYRSVSFAISCDTGQNVDGGWITGCLHGHLTRRQCLSVTNLG